MKKLDVLYHIFNTANAYYFDTIVRGYTLSRQACLL